MRKGKIGLIGILKDSQDLMEINEILAYSRRCPLIIS